MIGYAVNIGAHAWYQRLIPRFAAAAQAHGQELLVLDADGDPALQIDQIGALLDRGINALALSAVTPSTLDPMLDRCAANGIPVVTESIRLNRNNVVSHLSIDDYAVGVRLGARVGEQIPSSELVRVLLVGFPPCEEANDREAGFLSGLRQACEHVEAVYVQGGGTTELARRDVTATLATRRGWCPDIVFGVDDELLIGGLEALNARGCQPALTAANGISLPRGPKLLDEGVITWGAAMLPEMHGEILAALCLAALAGETVPSRVSPDAAIVTRSGNSEGWDRYYTLINGDWELDKASSRTLLPDNLLSLNGGPAW